MTGASGQVSPRQVASLSGRFWERVYAARDRLLASPKFHKFAAGFPLTKPIARRQARAAFDLCAGFVYSQILYACVQLGIFEILKDGPKSRAEIARATGLSDEAADRLLSGAIALRLLEKRDPDRFGFGMLGAALSADAGIKAMIEHHHLLYADLADPVALLKGETGETNLRRYWAYNTSGDPRQLGDADVAAYSHLMSASQTLVAGEILDAYDIARHQTLLDVGGGEGTFLAAAAMRAPDLNLMLFDLPAVARRAAQAFERLQLTGRSQTFGGSFLEDPLPRGADVISLVRVVHDHDDDAVAIILAAAYAALPTGGTLLVAEPLADTPGAEGMGNAYFGFYLLAMGHGRPRPYRKIETMLKIAGFQSVRRVSTRTPLQTSLIVAHR